MLVERSEGQWAIAGKATPGERSPTEKTIMTLHPAMFRAGPLKNLSLIFAIIIGLAGMVYFGAPIEGSEVDKWWRPLTLALSVMFGIFALVSLISIIYWFIRTRFEALTITSERTIWSRGIFDRETSEVQHDDIRNIQIKQTFIERVLGVGRLAISSAGQDEMEIDVRDVPNPSKVADMVRSCQARMSGRGD
jgi:uncharacterized membrane protein YdbT with pleckstrin-like domain